MPSRTVDHYLFRPREEPKEIDAKLRARAKKISHSGAGAGLQDTNASEMRRA
jgi:hypothetical protein